MDRGEDVPVDLVALQHVEAADDPVEGGLAALVDAVGVVHLRWAVDRDADEEVVLFEERAPVVVEQGAIGLHGVQNLLTGSRIPSFELDGSPEEVQAHQRRLPALPGDYDLGSFGVRLQELT